MGKTLRGCTQYNSSIYFAQLEHHQDYTNLSNENMFCMVVRKDDKSRYSMKYMESLFYIDRTLCCVKPFKVVLNFHKNDFLYTQDGDV